jgi:peptide-methionine (S)-S-oxide reductase
MRIYLFVCLILLSTGIQAAFAQSPSKNETAVFAGGCFWCMHAAFEQLPGVTKVTSGYTGGQIENPTYEQVSSGTTGHVEAIQVTYDPNKVAYKKLLEWFWDNVDPTDAEGQFCDKGTQYLAGIFYTTPAQKKEAQISIDAVEKKLKIKSEIFLRGAEIFYPAEEYHQRYYKKNSLRYQLYKSGCGRDKVLKKIWKP